MPSRLTRAWQISLGWLLGAIALGLIAGLAFGALPTCLLIVAVGYIVFNLVQLGRLVRWLAGGRRLGSVEGRGLWGELYDLIERRQRIELARRRRLVGLLRAFRDAASALPDAVVILDDERRILWFNAAARTLLALKYPQDIGGYLTNLVRAPRVVQWLAGGGAEPITDVASPLDENVRMSLRLIPYTERQALLVARDVSQLLRLEEVRRDFVANVSHELRTPLTVVHGYLDMLEPEQMPEFEEILRELRAQSRRMTQIVEDLLTLSRLEAQERAPEERVAMRPLVETLRREGEALSQGRHTVIAERASDDDLLGSTKDLHSAFSNLVTNAVRYTPDGGTITIRWDASSAGARLSVSDTGQGISPQHLPRLTERFYRVSTSRSRETGGTGLGLSIVKHVLQLHQARLEVASEVDVGSTFSCVFGGERVLSPATVAEEA